MALLMLKSSGFHGSPYAKELVKIFSLPDAFTTNKQNFKAEQRCRDGIMNEFVSG